MVLRDRELLLQHNREGASISIRAVNPQQDYNPQTKGAERRAGILIPPGYLPPEKGKH
jgi:hypothetical protein